MITKNDRRLGKMIKRKRKARNLTQEDLATHVGVTGKYIQYLESAKRKPAIRTLYRIARVLGVKVQELFPF